MQDDGRRQPAVVGHRVTWWLVGINAGLWFLFTAALNWGGGIRYVEPTTGLGGFVYQHLMLHPRAVVESLEVWQLFTAFWLHDPGSVWHVLINMVLLFFFGRSVETYLGGRRFLVLYLGGGLASTVLYVAFAYATGRLGPALGASGAVYAVMVWLACREPNRIFYFFFVLRMPLWVLVGVILVGREMVELSSAGARAGAAVGHLAGAAWGWLYYRRTRMGAPSSGGPGAWMVALRRKRATHRLDREQRTEAEIRHRVDRLLAKINEEGIDALTEEQKAFLQEASKRYK
jgi:membrane associated rhomboid family serine protease